MVGALLLTGVLIFDPVWFFLKGAQRPEIQNYWRVDSDGPLSIVQRGSEEAVPRGLRKGSDPAAFDLLTKAGVTGPLRHTGYGYYGSGPPARILLVLNGPVTQSVELPQPNRAQAVYVQVDDGFRIYPPSVRTRDDLLILEPGRSSGFHLNRYFGGRGLGSFFRVVSVARNRALVMVVPAEIGPDSSFVVFVLDVLEEAATAPFKVPPVRAWLIEDGSQVLTLELEGETMVTTGRLVVYGAESGTAALRAEVEELAGLDARGVELLCSKDGKHVFRGRGNAAVVFNTEAKATSSVPADFRAGPWTRCFGAPSRTSTIDGSN